MDTILKLTNDQDCKYLYIPLSHIAMFRDIYSPGQRPHTEIWTINGTKYLVTEKASYIRKHYCPPRKKHSARDHHDQNAIPEYKKEQT
jgi:hypothetical protein